MSFGKPDSREKKANHEQKEGEITSHQLKQFQDLIVKLFQCCQERMQYQSDRFNLPDAELRCLMLFGEERYLTPKGIAYKMNVVKSRISKIIDGLLKKDLIQRIKDPEDSRISLLSLTGKEIFPGMILQSGTTCILLFLCRSYWISGLL